MSKIRGVRADTFAGMAFSRYGAELQLYLLRRLQRTHDADDVMQEVFLRLLRVENTELVRNPRAYIYGIAFHVIREFRIRDERAGTWITFDPETIARRAEQPEELRPDELADNFYIRRQLERAIRQLPRIHRAVFLLHKRDGYTYREVAEKLGLSIHTVDKYLVEAKVKIRMMEWDR